MIRRKGARRRRAAGVAGVLLLVAACGWTAWQFRPWEAWAQPAAESTEPVTAPVELATLTEDVRLSGQLGYGDAAPLPASPGTITVLPTAGQVIATGQQVWEEDGHPVVLFRGARPFWRELSVTQAQEGESTPPPMSGEDVRQLQQNLSDLGFYRSSIDGQFADLTRRAVRAWQKSLGMEQTGVFSPSSAVVVDAPGIRIAQVTARLGETGVSPATSTETTLRATATLTAAQARELTAGTPVTVTLPDGTEIDAVLSAIDPGGQPTDEEGKTTSPSTTIEFADQTQVSAAGAVAVRITIRADSAQEPALVVPATALLAAAGGGYAVEVFRDDAITRIPVTIGLVADARVQILSSEGDALTEGDLVVLSR